MRKYILPLILAATIPFSGCSKKQEVKPERCRDFTNIERMAKNKMGYGEVFDLARKYDVSAHRLKHEITNNPSSSNLNGLYGAYLTNSLNLTVYGSKNRSRSNQDVIFETHQHVFSLGLDTNEVIQRLKR